MKTSIKKKKTKEKDGNIRADAKARFERAVDIAVMSKPIHKVAKSIRAGRGKS
jgi:hypothetical protein